MAQDDNKPDATVARLAEMMATSGAQQGEAAAGRRIGPQWAEDLEGAYQEFQAGRADSPEPAGGSRVELLSDREGSARRNLTNCTHALEGRLLWLTGAGGAAIEHEFLGKTNPMHKVIAFDEFGQRVMLWSPAPWCRLAPGETWKPRPWEDSDDRAAVCWLESMRISCDPKLVGMAVNAAADRHPYNPARDYLDGLQWDGHPRLDFWLGDHLGVEDSSLTRAFAAKVLIAAVRRVKHPGCKCDTMMILCGLGGSFKSRAIATLFGEFFADEEFDIGSKDAVMLLSGFMCHEVGEMQFGRVTAGQLKAFLSRQRDRIRVPYGRRISEFPRLSIFIGTTDRKLGALMSGSGWRRFWPVDVKDIDIEGLRLMRDKLFAEAVEREAAGEAIYLDTKELEDEARGAVEAREPDDIRRAMVATWLDRLPKEEREAGITMERVAKDALGLEPAKLERGERTSLGIILHGLGWHWSQLGKRQIRTYKPPIDEESA